MSHVQKSEGLTFKSPKKVPSRKFNPVLIEANLKTTMKSASKNKISSNKSLPKSSSSRQKTKFRAPFPDSHSKNAESQSSSRKVNESAKQHPCSETYSFSSETELQPVGRGQTLTAESLLNKRKSIFAVELQLKKDRKLSDNIHDMLSIYQQLKAEHQMQEKQLLPELSEKELYRLRKIYATQEAKCMFKALHKAKN